MENENIHDKNNSNCMNRIVETTNNITLNKEQEHSEVTACGKHSSKWCPVNDPTPSTCEFLLKMKNCCNTRSCQLAAKICDLYAPLYSMEESVGNPKYHYLLKDMNTQVGPSEEALVVPSAEPPEVVPSEEAPKVLPSVDLEIDETPPQSVMEEPSTEEMIEEEITSSESLQKVIDLEPPSMQKISEEELQKPAPSVIENVQVPEVDDFSYTRATDTRTSVVSWDVRASRAVRSSSTSQEQIINRAKHEANQFRLRGADQVLFRKKIFSQSKERIPSEETSEENLKSQLESVAIHDSAHNQNCCACLKRKSRKKKNQEPCREDGSVIWRASEEPEKRKKTKLSNTPVQEKKQQINTMLSKM